MYKDKNQRILKTAFVEPIVPAGLWRVSGDTGSAY